MLTSQLAMLKYASMFAIACITVGSKYKYTDFSLCKLLLNTHTETGVQNRNNRTFI